MQPCDFYPWQICHCARGEHWGLQQVGGENWDYCLLLAQPPSPCICNAFAYISIIPLKKSRKNTLKDCSAFIYQALYIYLSSVNEGLHHIRPHKNARGLATRFLISWINGDTSDMNSVGAVPIWSLSKTKSPAKVSHQRTLTDFANASQTVVMRLDDLRDDRSSGIATTSLKYCQISFHRDVCLGYLCGWA